jgi:hypothetical protein
MAVGTFEQFSAGGILPSMDLTLRDDESGSVTQYLLSAGTTLDGHPLCASKSGYCLALPPAIVAGKTHLAVLYWQPAFADFPTYRGADTIITLSSSTP